MRLFALDDAACSALATQHGTPSFIYDGAAAEAQFSALRAALPRRVRLAYAVKANPHPELLKRFVAMFQISPCAAAG